MDAFYAAIDGKLKEKKEEARKEEEEVDAEERWVSWCVR